MCFFHFQNVTSDTNFFLDEDEMDGWLFEETKLDDLVILKKNYEV